MSEERKEPAMVDRDFLKELRYEIGRSSCTTDEEYRITELVTQIESVVRRLREELAEAKKELQIADEDEESLRGHLERRNVRIGELESQLKECREKTRAEMAEEIAVHFENLPGTGGWGCAAEVRRHFCKPQGESK